MTWALAANSSVCGRRTGPKLGTILTGLGTFQRQVAFSPDSRYFYTGGDAGTARVYALPGGEEVRVLTGHVAAGSARRRPIGRLWFPAVRVGVEPGTCEPGSDLAGTPDDRRAGRVLVGRKAVGDGGLTAV
ncbi:MAG: hypothetical protein M5U12_12695 [Verrucomicrobia bacterium]|nr:hypothetical protein [Verrucomicrobiota bacterium]